MLKHAVKQIEKSKLNVKPFPYFKVDNLIPAKNLQNLNKTLPSFKEVAGNDILFQSASQTKKRCYRALPFTKNLKKIKISKILICYLKN